ncbi:MAG: hypothetical protein R3B97_11915 [Dehalococcoidia bacterium]|nr:hypothetical protein [Dehalococcoidia bacterium]MCB9484655.1 hypothetical protein [Thermoflexaceae bacterium]
MPDLLIATACAAVVMAVVLGVSTMLGDRIVFGDTGRALARLFAGSLAVAGLLLFLIALVLLRDERSHADHYRGPGIIGGAVGAAEAGLFLAESGRYLWIPPVCLLFALRPLRRLITAVTGLGGGR